MIAYCGIDCSKCDGYLATQSGDEKKIQAVADLWSSRHNADVKPEHVICDGCKAGGRKSFHCENSCTIRQCCLKKKIMGCMECEDFPCEDETFILDNVPDARENLEKIKS